MKWNPEKKRAGILVPVFALRTEKDLGIGDTDGVRQVIDWCVRHGFSLLQLLPIQETGSENSPYDVVSSVALDPTTVAISPQHLPELTQEDFEAVTGAVDLEDLRQGPVQYGRVKGLKQQLLERAFQNFSSSSPNPFATRQIEFQVFCQAHADWLEDYILFRTLIGENHGNAAWETWIPAWQSPTVARKWLGAQSAAVRDRFRRSQQFFQYVQWIARQQWEEVRRYAEERGVGLMGDIPFGSSRNSADVWAERELFNLDWSGGAPPEPSFKPNLFTEKWGQNWGIPLYRWEAHRARNFDWWRRRVKKTCEIFHLFRLDHVLGFYRLYAFPWRPQQNEQYEKLSVEEVREKMGGWLPRFWPNADDTEPHREANRRQGDEILRVLQEAARPGVVIAEDLGTVPPYVRPHLASLGIAGFKIPSWERNPDYTYEDPKSYSPLSVATPATHDHETLAGQWRDLWKEHHRAQALHDHERAHISWLELQRFVWWTGGEGQQIPVEFTAKLHEAFCRRILCSPSWMVIFILPDVFGEELRFNVPGEFAESNWTARLAYPVSQWGQIPLWAEKARRMTRLIQESDRAGDLLAPLDFQP